MFDTVALIGVGLIGSSLARALRKYGLARKITGCARTPETRAKLLELKLTDTAHADPAAAVKGADLVVICTPLSTYSAIARAIGPRLKKGAIVTDVGSVKMSTLRDLLPHLPPGIAFVPGHPVAGTEHSGPEAGFAELFQDRWCILTPTPETDAKAVKRISELWRKVGSRVELMDPAHHDRVLATTSHLPHLIAYTIVGTATELEGQLRAAARPNDRVEQAEVIKFSAGGFRDFTRIAASDPVMWRDIFLANREAVLEMLARFNEDLTALQRAIRFGEGEKLETWFRRTREIRRGIVEAGQAGTFQPTEPTGSKPAASPKRPARGKPSRPRKKAAARSPASRRR
ncbi:MAG: prephenate/arogenate dehydrogenase family protein [Alphaproteobacteria bacterium]|nr:prephenate/arogenate dehydrogenase family protein [Alphaproteobacteria bacterium]